MSTTIGGLFNVRQDLQLVKLSIHESTTHTFLTNTFLTHTFLTHNSFHRQPTTPPPKYVLYVPHLHFPWSTQLSDILYRTLHLSLQPVNNTPPTKLTPLSFLPALPPPKQFANCKTLTTINTTHPGILPRLAIFVKLAYCNTLLQRLLRLLNSTKSDLLTTTHTPHPPTKAIPTKPRPGAAESGHLVTTPPPQPRTTPLPPQPTTPSAAVTITAHPLPNHRGAPSAYLLHGVSVPSQLLSSTISLLRTYAILVHVPTPQPPATLANLSNLVFRLDKRPIPGRGPRIVDDPVDKFVFRAYGIEWPSLCTAIVRQARVSVEKQRVTDLRQRVVALQAAVLECRKLRQSLVDQAIAKEVAGSSLLNMCAFAIAQSDNGQFEREFSRFGNDCVRRVCEARRRICQISAEDTKSATVLAAGMRDAR